MSKLVNQIGDDICLVSAVSSRMGVSFINIENKGVQKLSLSHTIAYLSLT